MALISSTETLTAQDQRLLLAVAEQSIRHGWEKGTPLPVRVEEYPATLHPLRATFVTLHHHGDLRGCIGTLTAEYSLVEDVALHAFAAAFEDPRFPPLREYEWDGLDIEISILTPSAPLIAATEAKLLEQLRVGEDGLILREGGRRATFLPSVWEMLPNPREFLAHLKMKAGLPADYWSDKLRFERYATVHFSTHERVTHEGQRKAEGT